MTPLAAFILGAALGVVLTLFIGAFAIVWAAISDEEKLKEMFDGKP